MPMPEGRTIRRTFLGTWLTAGVLATAYGLSVSGCTPVTPVIEAIPPVEPIDSLETAEQAWRAERIADHESIWAAENGPNGDPFSAGVAAFRLATATFDSAWASEAIDAFDRALANTPGLALARAWRGSAHALIARDYPVKGLWQIVPGPGFVRLYHVRAALSDLDEAVGTAPGDPFVRLVRASTLLAMPAVFGGAERGLSDFATLRDWTRDPDRNPEFSEILRSPGWRQEYFLARSRAMEAFGAHDDAARSWERLSESTDNPTLQELAKWHRISLGASR